MKNAHGWRIAEHGRSVRNSDVEVSRTPDLKFWMFLGARRMRSITSAESDIVQHPQSSGATHSWAPDTELDLVRSASPETLSGGKPKKLVGASRKKEQRRGALPRLEGPSLCKMGWALKSHLCLSIRGRGLAVQEMLKSCSTFSRGQEVRDFLPCPLSPKPTKAEVKLESHSASS